MSYELAIISAALVLAGFIKGFSGFGTSIILSGALLIFYAPREIIPVLALISIILNLMLIVEHKKYFKTYKSNFAFQKETLIFLLLGTILGTYLLKILNTSVIKIIFGITILVFLFLLKHKVSKHKFKIPVWEQNAFLGGLTGLFSGLINVNGPPVMIYGLHQQYNKIKLMRSMLVFLLLADFITIITFSINGLYSSISFMRFISFFPIIILGFIFGKFTRQKTDDTKFKKIIMIFLGIISIQLILDNLLKLF